MSEAELQSAVLELAKRLGWRTAHFRPGMTKRGKWVTAVSGDGKGFPDLVLVRDNVLMFVELKSDAGKPTREQLDWLDALDEAGCDTDVWCPADWHSGYVERSLRSGGRQEAA